MISGFLARAYWLPVRPDVSSSLDYIDEGEPCQHEPSAIHVGIGVLRWSCRDADDVSADWAHLRTIEWLSIAICLSLTYPGSTAILQINGEEEEVEAAD